ncbi:hypothetical protein GN244_ATG05157 [Phytophthora infestans]|uniref:RxLR effector PexRD54 WY domain-containing protein n=1 Tax=Phytophthora infestans TaxID=4787 RepID=A0A833TA12_PHYIN|nr:hypothetical protein GN244_ATG05157 [Phytophthora infestans]
MLEVTTKYYGNGALKEMIDQAKHSTIPRTYKGTAQRLQTQIWLREGKIAGDGFKLFDLHERGDALFENPAFLKWVSYFNKFHNSKKSQDEFAIISELAKRFDDELDLARALSDAMNNPALRGNTEKAMVTLQKLQFKQWMWKKDWNPKELRYALVPHNADPRYLGVRLGFDTFYKATRGS